MRSGVPIAGATHAQYHGLPTGYTGHTLIVSVTGSKTAYASATVASAPTLLVTGGKLTGVRPTISGTSHVGSTLTAVTGAWSPAPVSLAIQWLRDGKKDLGCDRVELLGDRRGPWREALRRGDRREAGVHFRDGDEQQREGREIVGGPRTNMAARPFLTG